MISYIRLLFHLQNPPTCLSFAHITRRSLYGLYPYKSSMIGMENLTDPSENWDIVETIGKGTYGKVYRVTSRKDGSQAAVKVLDPINVSRSVFSWRDGVCVRVL